MGLATCSRATLARVLAMGPAVRHATPPGAVVTAALLTATLLTATLASAAPAAAATSTFLPVADTRVHEARPTTNYGTSHLRTDGGTGKRVESLLRFAVTGLDGTVLSARLRLYATTTSADGPAAYPTTATWTEQGTTWSNRPAATGPATADLGAVASGSWVELDVTPLVAGSGTFAFLLRQPSTDGTYFESREQPRPPQLVVQWQAAVCETTPCDDGNVCTDDACVAGACQFTANTSLCSDGDACTLSDACADGACVAGPIDACADGSPCTADSCTAGACQHVPVSGPCSDGNACTADDTCDGGECVPGTPKVCDDGDPCTSDACLPGTGACATTPACTATLVPLAAVWRYKDDGVDPGPGWRAIGFQDSGWKAGPAELGYGDGDEATVVGYGPEPSDKFITTWFRHRFTVTGSGWQQVTVRLERDDGAAVYLNGTEVLRSNLPSGPLTATTLASTTAEGGTFVEATIDPALLQAGDNVLAVEVHQRSKASSDLSFRLELQAASQATQGTLVARGATWRYRDDGSDQGTGWTAPDFSDSGWQAGPAELGYGDGDEATVVSYGTSSSAKHVTTYFRHRFQVADPAAFASLTLGLERDDGAAVYLNGSEVFRSNLPAGPLTATTLASSAVEGGTLLSAPVPPSLLVAGDNVLAVEVHQASPASSDLSFDLQLVGQLGSPPPPPPPPSGDPVLVGAGDIGVCSSSRDSDTSALLDGIAGTVITLGDNAYPGGTAEDFLQCFDPAWGRHKARIRPSAGNHDYLTAGAAGYFGYFGSAAGDPATGYYSYTAGDWLVVVLNSNCGAIGGCQAGSAQEVWLRQVLAAHPGACQVAYMHHPHYTTGPRAGSSVLHDLWQALHDHKVELALAGHDHTYERWAPQDAHGNVVADGVVQIVAGTGGAPLYAFAVAQPPASLVRNNQTWGVVELTLHPASYDLRFVPIAGLTFTDNASGACR